MKPRNSLIPDQHWGSDTAKDFLGEDFPDPNTSAFTLLCRYCVKENSKPTSNAIILIDGNSVCRDHAASML